MNAAHKSSPLPPVQAQGAGYGSSSGDEIYALVVLIAGIARMIARTNTFSCMVLEALHFD